MKNKISVLITNYNKSQFLFKTLRSVCDQNFRNYEIILYDDASSDNSIEIIKKFKKVKLITNKKKKNISAPLNQINGVIQCFKKSKGNILLLLDGDDVFKKYKLKKIDQFFKDNKKINCVFDIPLNNINQFKLKKNQRNIQFGLLFFPLVVFL
jgi:glycosyltransferase involved in cell wall biosynthesis